MVNHYQANHSRSPEGRFIVPLPKHSNVPDLGESWSQAVRRFLTLERSLCSKGEFNNFAEVMREYFTLSHAEKIPTVDLQKPPRQVYYMPMHAVKNSSVTTKLRVVFDASAKTSTDVSLNDTLMVGPTLHSSLVDVLLISTTSYCSNSRCEQNVSSFCTQIETIIVLYGETALTNLLSTTE